jgi:hypothetical protein
MIPNQGRWLAVTLYALLGAWGCAEGTQQQPPPNPLVGRSGSGGTGNAGSAAAAGATSPRAGIGGASASGTAGRVASGGAGGASAAGRGGAGGAGGAAMDAGIPKPGTADAGLADDTDAGLDDPTAEEWAGTTSQGLDMNFTVTEAGLRELRLQYAFPPVCDGDNTARFDPPAPLADPFSVSFVLAGATNATFSGTFASDGRSASGRLNFMSTLMPGQPACGVGVVTWNATRQ